MVVHGDWAVLPYVQSTEKDGWYGVSAVFAEEDGWYNVSAVFVFAGGGTRSLWQGGCLPLVPLDCAALRYVRSAQEDGWYTVSALIMFADGREERLPLVPLWRGIAAVIMSTLGAHWFNNLVDSQGDCAVLPSVWSARAGGWYNVPAVAMFAVSSAGGL
eukprot:3390630-Pleurochrysis_carterae.AAC.3